MSLLLDISGLEALFKLHYKSLCITSFRIVEDKGIAEDIVHDAFRKLWETGSKKRIQTSIKTQLIQNTIDSSLSYVKRYKITVASPDPNANFEDAENAVSEKGVGVKIEKMVSALPDICRLVFVLNRYERLSYKETATRLGISEEAVAREIIRAMRHFYKVF